MTFAPVAKMTIGRVLVSEVTAQQWPLFQLDVKNAFLNSYLSEEIYMRPPPGFSSPPALFCRLRRALYGLKQSSHALHECFQSMVLGIGF